MKAVDPLKSPPLLLRACQAKRPDGARPGYPRENQEPGWPRDEDMPRLPRPPLGRPARYGLAPEDRSPGVGDVHDFQPHFPRGTKTAPRTWRRRTRRQVELTMAAGERLSVNVGITRPLRKPAIRDVSLDGQS